jgi:DNA-binding CsgD family transcriptional regulator
MDLYNHPEARKSDDLYVVKRIPGDKYSITLHRRNHLTPRELEALGYIAAGFSSGEIAERLFLSVETIHSHRKNIIRKLGVPNVAAAVAHAIRHQLIQ